VDAYFEILERETEDVLFYSSDTPDQIRVNQTFGAERVAGLLEETMGRLAVKGRELGYERIFVAGGETSGRVMLELGYRAFEIHESVAPGVPRMTPLDDPAVDLVLKSGNFGDEDILLTALV